MARTHICGCGKEFEDAVTKSVESFLPDAQQTAQYKEQEDAERKKLRYMCPDCNARAAARFKGLRKL